MTKSKNYLQILSHAGKICNIIFNSVTYTIIAIVVVLTYLYYTCYRRNWVLLADTVRNYRSPSLLACKQGLSVKHSHGRELALLRQGVKGTGSGHGKVRVARGKGEHDKSIRSFCSENLHGWRDGGKEGNY